MFFCIYGIKVTILTKLQAAPAGGVAVRAKNLIRSSSHLARCTYGINIVTI